MNSLSHSGNQQAGSGIARSKLLGPAENWDMVEKKESILTCSLLALGSENGFFFCLRNRFPLILCFIVSAFSSSHRISTPWIIYMFTVSSLEGLSSLKLPGVALQLTMGSFPSNLCLGVVPFASSFVILH